jgi:glucokinase
MDNIILSRNGVEAKNLRGSPCPQILRRFTPQNDKSLEKLSCIKAQGEGTTTPSPSGRRAGGEGFVIRLAPSDSEEGAMARSPEVALAMDWGGTWARASVVNRQGEVLWNYRVANAQGVSKEQLIEDAEQLLRRAIDWCGNRSIAGLGVAIAGPVEAETGTLYGSPNLSTLNGVSLKALWEPTLGFPVFVGNDANLAALGEFQYGAGLEARKQGNPPRTLLYMTVSTGIGGGVVDRGQMFLGASGVAVEVGHMTIDFSSIAPRCQCGNTGCLEALASGTAIAKIAQARLARQDAQTSSLAAMKADTIDSEIVFEEAGKTDALALSILEDVVLALSIGLTNLLHLYNPDLIVLGGGVTGGLIELGLLPRINSLMLHRAMSDRHKEFRLVASRLGDSVGMIGAAGLVWEKVGTFEV